MKPQWNVIKGDCCEIAAQMEPNSVDSVVTDPPYELGFMGKTWDRSGIAFKPSTWAEFERVLKPGGYLLSFGGTRTFHRIAVAIEDAGFEIRDTLVWLYGSGFPKSHDVSKAIDKAAGAEREVVGSYKATGTARTLTGGNYGGGGKNTTERDVIYQTAPATDLARQWDGYGTALKPAWEPIILARKPLIGTVAQNVVEFGTGALNIDGCRIETNENLNGGAYSAESEAGYIRRWEGGEFVRKPGQYKQPIGRWPANVILDEEAAAMLDEQTGVKDGGYVLNRTKGMRPFNNNGAKTGYETTAYIEEPSGGASRFFYCAKANRQEREAGLENREKQSVSIGDTRPSGGMHERYRTANGSGKTALSQNTHPTVKPIALMRYLARLVTPPGGEIFDPFCGSGSTGIGAVLEGFDFFGVDTDDEPNSTEIARARIEWWLNNPPEYTKPTTLDLSDLAAMLAATEE